MTVTPPARRRSPSWKILENSLRLRSDRKDRPLRGEALSALFTPPLDDGASGTSPHAVAESVLALASAHIGLISTFHGKRIRNKARGSPVGYEPAASFVKGTRARIRRHTARLSTTAGDELVLAAARGAMSGCAVDASPVSRRLRSGHRTARCGPPTRRNWRKWPGAAKSPHDPRNIV